MTSSPDCSCGRGTYRPERSCYSGRLMAARCSACNKVTGRCSCEYDTHRDTPMTTPDLRSAADDIFDRLMTLWQEPWSELAFGEAQMLISRLRAALASQPEPGPTADEWTTLREAFAIGAVSYDGDSWFAADAGYGYDEAEATMNAARAILARLSETPR